MTYSLVYWHCWTQGQMQCLDVPCRRKMRRRQGRGKLTGTTGGAKKMLCIVLSVHDPWYRVFHIFMGQVTKERLRVDSKYSLWVLWCEPWVPQEFMIRYASFYRFLEYAEYTFLRRSRAHCAYHVGNRTSQLCASTFPVLAIKLYMVHAEGEPQQCQWIVVDEESVQA
jgi:hypothetical protein